MYIVLYAGVMSLIQNNSTVSIDLCLYVRFHFWTQTVHNKQACLRDMKIITGTDCVKCIRICPHVRCKLQVWHLGYNCNVNLLKESS